MIADGTSEIDVFAPKTQAWQPTSAAPGSAEKIEVMRRRVANGEYLHHPDDAGQALLRLTRREMYLADEYTDHIKQHPDFHQLHGKPRAFVAPMPDPNPVLPQKESVPQQEHVAMDIKALLDAAKLLAERAPEAIAAIDGEIASHQREIDRLMAIRRQLNPTEVVVASPSVASKSLRPIPDEKFSLIESKIVALLSGTTKVWTASEVGEAIRETACTVGRVVKRSSKLRSNGKHIRLA